MCTGVRFVDNNGGMYFGRNLDWSVPYGQKVVITPRGYKYNSAFLGEMSVRGESGLAIAGLNFPGYAKYAEAAVDGKTNVAAYEFPLWVVANFTTVAEVEKALKEVAIVAKPINEQYPVSELHWIIGDKERSIVVEYSANGMEIFENDVDILTNQPGYGWHKENLRNYMNLFSQMPKEVRWGKAKMTAFGTGSLMQGLPGDYYSPSRFVRVAYLNTHYPVKGTEEENVSRLFHTLAGVAMIDGAAQMGDGKCELTIYTGGYSAPAKTYYYNTYENPAIQKVAMSDYNLDTAELMQI